MTEKKQTLGEQTINQIIEELESPDSQINVPMVAFRMVDTNMVKSSNKAPKKLNITDASREVCARSLLDL